jgi:hypothetical protein
MTTAAFTGTGLFVWSRRRAIVVICASIYAVLLIASESLTAQQLQPYQAQILTFLRASPFFLPLLLFVTPSSVFTLDLAARDSQFPRHLFTLPLSSRQLVLPFMAGAVLLSALLWLLADVISSGRVFTSGPLHLPVEQLRKDFWFPFLLASLIVWTQALLWTSFRRGQARVWALFALVIWHAVLLVLAVDRTIPGPMMLALGALQVLLAYPVAVWAVGRARRGDPSPAAAHPRGGGLPLIHLRPRGEKQTRAHPPFASPLAAQGWFEWQAHRTRNKSPFLLFVPFVLALALLAHLKTTAIPGGGAMEAALALLKQLAWLLTVIPVLTGPYAASFHSRVEWNRDNAFVMPAFFAALPLSTGDFAWAKMKLAAGAMLVFCAVLALMTLLLLPLFDLHLLWVELLAALRANYAFVHPVLLVAALLVAITLLSAAQGANYVWVALFGRGWILANVVMAAVAIALLIGLPTLLRDPARAARVQEMLPVALAVLAFVKLGVLAVLAEQVRRREHYPAKRIALIAGGWVVAVVAAFLMWRQLAPDIEPRTALSTLVLLTPVLGFFAAPLALQWNRAR